MRNYRKSQHDKYVKLLRKLRQVTFNYPDGHKIETTLRNVKSKCLYFESLKPMTSEELTIFNKRYDQDYFRYL